MSDINELDDEFMAAADEYAQEEQNRTSRRGTGGNQEYIPLKWTGLVTKQPKIIRVLGGVPNKPNPLNTDARLTQVARIKGDDGKYFRCILPLKEEGADHVLWRIINRINETAYVNRKRISVNETKHKEIFDLVNYNGLVEGDKGRMYERGWEGSKVIVMNVIDREQMSWHRENKHTMLLSKNINKNGDREYVTEGVPSFGFYTLIVSSLFKNYGSWENYDIQVIRTGNTQPAYEVLNASAFVKGKIPQILPSLVPLVSLEEHLTEEEKSWERYDLSKLYHPTSYTKIFNKLKVAVQKIDARLNTKFFQELEHEVEKEKAARAAAQPQEAGPASEAPVVEEAKPAAAPAVASRPIIREGTKYHLSAEEISSLKGYGLLTPEQASIIRGVKIKNGEVAEIDFDTQEPIVACPSCRVASPEFFDKGCVACGISW